MTSYLCELLKVSRSGYYRWLSAEETRQQREYNDERDALLIQEHFDDLRGKAGALMIKMRLQQLSYVIMNHKKIRRLMKKYHLVATIRQVNPYRKMAKATQEHSICPNLLKRQFDQGEPDKVFLTDITYLRYGQGQTAFLSAVKDSTTRQVPVHYVSTSLDVSLSIRTFERLLEHLDGNIHPEAMIHSDQGIHYTHPTFRLKVNQAGFLQSMSRKGNCWDNASMESFFGHMKDELDLSDCMTLEEVRNRVQAYMDYYNSERFQWTLKKMTPDQFRSHLLTA